MRTRRRRNPMPTSGAIFLTNGKRRHRNGRKSSPHGRLLARFNRRRSRRNGLAVRTNSRRFRRRRNPLQASAIFRPVEKLLSMIPGGKKIAPYVAPAAYGAIGLLGVHFALKYGAKYLPAQIRTYVAPIGYTLGGILLGVAVQFLPIGASDKKALAAAMVVGGAGVDVFRKLTGSTALGDEFGNEELGEGGLWQLGDEYGDAALAFGDPEMGDIMGDYADAEMADAYYSGADLDSVEGEAALAGPRAWRARFPKRKRAAGARGALSRHAGQHGHRWGWLAKLIGFEKFRAVVALPAPARVAYLAQLRKHALSSIPQGIGPAAALRAGPAAALPGGGEGDNFTDLGATLYSGAAGAAY